MAGIESVARAELRRRIARHGLTRDTLALIADALYPRGAARQLSEHEVGQVNEAIDTLVLSGLSDGAAIADALRAGLASGREDWREALWRERLSLAATAEAHESPGDGDDGTDVSTVPAIPPQPPAELEDGEAHGDQLAA